MKSKNRQILSALYSSDLVLCSLYSLLIASLLLLLSACTTPDLASPTPQKEKIEPTKSTIKPLEQTKSDVVKPSKAANLTAYQREIAIHLSQKNPDKIYVSNPQALLRSVVVIKFSIDASGKLLSRDMLRSNKDKETEGTAMQSLSRAQAFPAPPASLLLQGKVELIETWLFNTDGRFQLRTIALPQLGE
ncbi:hypothetical protein RF679_09255 [Undibacterium cyanobacteriorum]|uniref:TonB C-terminal domain-containing protein n=1 Tax=Undibacterium cyanobacteriorum TaxID=3073561 RepID=A0ABY9RMK8_9BURK|nr:hypothetical protein [Undibacterium sp. 20NA77.5]WMW82447.1 hypothetical protein RF679_09255 [Undibacterium sp. 20NA77.5]